MMRYVGLLLLLILCACSMQNSATLTFSSKNTPVVSLKVNNGTKYTKSTSVPLEIKASAEVAEMTVSLSTSCSDSWESYQQVKTLTVPSIEKEHTISVQVRTVDGFFSACTQETITYDQTSPVAPGAVTLVNTRSLLTESPKINLPGFSDALSGIQRYELKLIHNLTAGGTEIIKDWTEKSESALYFSGLNLPDSETETYYYVIRAVDRAGNVSSELNSPTFIPGPIVTFSNSSAYAASHTMGQIVVNLSRAITSDVTVTARAISGSAIAGIDFLYPDITTDTITIAASKTTGMGYFAIKSTTLETSKSFDVQMVSVNNAASTLPKMNIGITYSSLGTNTIPIANFKNITGYSNSYHSGIMCALTAANNLECWGKIGSSSTNLNSKPTAVSGLSNISSLSSGSGQHVCAIDNAGDLYCVGDNTHSQLGGTVTDATNPLVKHPTLSNVKKVSVGKDFTCVINSADTVQCWGNNAFCAIGQSCSTATDYTTPTTIAGLTKAIAISAGNDIACAIDQVSTNTRTVKCWGLTSGVTTGSATLVSITNIPNDIQQISATGEITTQDTLSPNHFGCGTTSSGDVYCWGSNTDLQRGSASTALTWSVANQVSLSEKATKILTGPGRSCAQTESGKLYCWGTGIPSVTDSNVLLTSETPTLISGLTEAITDFAVTEKFDCAVTISGRPLCWGWNTLSFFGADLSNANKSRQIAFTNSLTDLYSQVVVGLDSSCALRSTAKTVTCWGQNNWGQLGLGDRNTRLNPGATVGLASTVKKISGNNRTFCALLESGALYCWGYNGLMQIGNGNTTSSYFSSPQAVTASSGTALSGVTDVDVGAAHVCAIVSGTVKCWGQNSSYQAGQTAIAAYPSAMDVPNLTGVTNIASGTTNSCAISATSTTKSVYCWGDASNKVLGNTSTSTYTPALIETITTTSDMFIAVGWSDACYNLSGTTKCWGTVDSNKSGPFTDAQGTLHTTPVTIPYLQGISSLTLGTYNGCSTDNYAISCWGYDHIAVFGSLNTNSPVEPYAFKFGKAKNISLSRRYEPNAPLTICAISVLGTLHCFGTGPGGNNQYFFGSPTSVLK